jgi:hypothetical protein
LQVHVYCWTPLVYPCTDNACAYFHWG